MTESFILLLAIVALMVLAGVVGLAFWAWDLLSSWPWEK